MDHLRLRLPRLLKTVTYSAQSVRHKGERRPYQNSWKPIPERTRRDEYFMIKEKKEWQRPLMALKERLAATKDDPAPKPSIAHVVTRVKTLKHQPRTNKKLCEHFGIDEKMHKQVLVPNTQANNDLLMQIKHLIRVKPLSLPDGLPEVTDLHYTQLRSDGSLHVVKSIGENTEIPSLPEKPTHLLKGDTIRRTNKYRVDNHQILKEYFKSTYTWKYNEDGKQWSYNPKQGN